MLGVEPQGVVEEEPQAEKTSGGFLDESVIILSYNLEMQLIHLAAADESKQHGPHFVWRKVTAEDLLRHVGSFARSRLSRMLSSLEVGSILEFPQCLRRVWMNDFEGHLGATTNVYFTMGIGLVLAGFR